MCFFLATISTHLSVYRAPPMFRVTLWLQLVLVVLILRQSAAVSDQCIELQEDISRLKRDLVRIIELKNENELRAGNCDVSSYIKICSFCKLLVLLSNTYVTVSWVQTYINWAVTVFDCNICVVRDKATVKISLFRTQHQNSEKLLFGFN
jgi:hypothetical protein